MRLFTSSILAAAVVGIGLSVPAAPRAAGRAEVMWDRYGVPHIFAGDRESMFYGEGWAQMEAQANLLLRLYGESRGRGAEYWGADNTELARWIQLNGVPERAQEWYDAQDPTFRQYLDAFARGINDYAAAHPDKIAADVRVVLPVTGVDVVGHPLRAVHYGYMGSLDRMKREVTAFRRGLPGAAAEDVAALEPENEELKAGSNTWAVGPSRSASGNAMLLINPHLAWGDTFYRYMEMHLVGPDYDFYGTPQVGFAVPVVGFNRHAGFGRTVNTIDTVDFFNLTLKDGGYVYDGQLRQFEREKKTFKIKQADGSLKEETLEIKRTVQGPVVYDDNGLMVTMRVAGLDRPRMLEQWFKMSEATNLESFTEALKIMAVPMWHANYVDDQKHMMFVFDGLVPRRKGHDYAFWQKVVPGNTSETMWTDYLSFGELPKSIDPPAGYHQNANEPPWDVTAPAIDRTKFASYIAPDGLALPQMRVLRSLKLITEPSVSYAQLVERKHSTRMELADRVLPDLIEASRGISEAARVLSKWDRTTDVDSRGAVLFQLWVDRYLSARNGGIASKLRVKFDAANPNESAFGLNDPAGATVALEEAAQECIKLYGALDVKWGDVFRFKSGDVDVPGNGGAGASGVFRTIAFTRRDGNRFYAAHGETIVCAIEFAATQRANCLLGYGNSSQPGSAHLGDQLPLMVQKALHPVWRERHEIEANLESREGL